MKLRRGELVRAARSRESHCAPSVSARAVDRLHKRRGVPAHKPDEPPRLNPWRTDPRETIRSRAAISKGDCDDAVVLAGLNESRQLECSGAVSGDLDAHDVAVNDAELLCRGR